MRLVWPFIFRVATKSPKIYTYANHPEKAPLDVRYNLCREAALSLYRPFRIKYIIKGEENLPEEEYCSAQTINQIGIVFLC